MGLDDTTATAGVAVATAMRSMVEMPPDRGPAAEPSASTLTAASVPVGRSSAAVVSEGDTPVKAMFAVAFDVPGVTVAMGSQVVPPSGLRPYDTLVVWEP